MCETEEKRKTYKNKLKTIKKTVIWTCILIITLSVNGLNAPNKRHRLAEWIQKQELIYMLSTRNPLHTSRHIWAESEMMEKYIPCKWEEKESWTINPRIRKNIYKINAKQLENGNRNIYIDQQIL